jgi:hypothetical protein
MFGWFKKDKPKVRIYNNGYVDYWSDEVEVIREVDVKPEKPDEPVDTIESMLNKFIESGQDKPEVVVNGVTSVSGNEIWSATIDGVKLEWVCRPYSIFTASEEPSEEYINKRVVDALKYMACKQIVSTTEITY